MEHTFNWIDFLSALILLFLLVYVLFKNEIRQMHKVFFLFHLAMMLWPYGMFSMSMAVNESSQWFYLNISFIGISFLGYAWLMFAVMLTRGTYKVQRRRCILCGLPAFLMAVLITCNPLHGQFASSHGDWVTNRTYGPIFWVVAAVSTSYLLIGCFILARKYVSTREASLRGQIFLFLLGQFIMLFMALADAVLSMLPEGNGMKGIVGLTSFGIVISDICFIAAIRSNQSFRVISLALREVVDSMDTGVVILDERHNVLDCNAVSKRYCDTVIGMPFPVELLLNGAIEPGLGREFLMSYYQETNKFLNTEVLIREEPPLYVSVRISPVYYDNGTFAGRIVMLQDVTEWRSLVYELHDRNAVLTLRNRELTVVQEELSAANQQLELLATTDPLTLCYNRRYLFQMLEYQLAVEQRYNVPFSLLMFDVDYFKQINDTHGHHVGDEVLQQMAHLIRGRLRESDIFARYGGEEFIVYLPHTEEEDALRLAESLRRIVESKEFRTERVDIKTTISVGLISIQGGSFKTGNAKQFLMEVLKMADHALYKAKKQGRNRVVAANA